MNTVSALVRDHYGVQWRIVASGGTDVWIIDVQADLCQPGMTPATPFGGSETRSSSIVTPVTSL